MNYGAGPVALCRKEARKNRLKEAAVAIKTTGKDQQVCRHHQT
jgi:hypothetical protein